MSKLDVQSFRLCSRAEGISVRDATLAPDFIESEAELRRQLPWPRTALGLYATIAELMDEVAQMPLQRAAL